MVETVKVPANVNYLSEWADFELPKGIVNKGITGCGATTLAIEDAHKTIICSPRINLITNKNGQHKKTLAVYGDVKNAEIESYLRNSPKPKILVTYDSMPRLEKLIKNKSDWRIVVDEYQYLLIDSGFKSETEMALLDILKSFPYVTYLSATPIADKYMLEMDCFRDLPYTVLEWSKVEQRFVKRVQSKNPINNAIEIVRNYQQGIYASTLVNGEKVESKECVIFLNSVANIVNIIKHTGLQANEVNIIVASTAENESLVKKLGKNYGIGCIPLKGERHKKVTFCTSTAFAGCDFYSTCASTFVISDNRKVHTSIDIATELAQIAGRQRLECNPFRHTVTFIYNVDDGENEASSYKAALERKWQKSVKNANHKNNVTDKDVREDFIKETVDSQKLNKYSDSYVWYDSANECFSVNRMAYLNDCFAFDVQRENYLNGIKVKRQLEDSGFSVSGKEEHSDYGEQLECIIKKEGFADRMKRYCEYRNKKENCRYFIADTIMERQYEDLKIYYDILGGGRVKALGYKEINLKNEIKRKQTTYQLYKEFRAMFPIGTKALTNDIKSKMEEVYVRYGINQKGVASHLEKRFGIKMKPVKIPLTDGCRKGGFEFI
ncbi:DEAD/DEAH box helicase family protein [Bacteroides fragilis]